MRLTKRKRETIAVMNMTPMIDVAFQLIIFFMTVTQVSELNRERLELPLQKGSEDQKPAILTINIDERGEFIVGGIPRSMSDLIGLVGDELTRLGDDPDRLTVMVRADRRAACEPVNRMVEALSRLRIAKLRFSVQVPE
ncbi:MAG: biopolymer transporter ExbD [Planctomycetes bacterium]|nr:biopolymer transporter ExbD [Planctomycetota bacterium]